MLGHYVEFFATVEGVTSFGLAAVCFYLLASAIRRFRDPQEEPIRFDLKDLHEVFLGGSVIPLGLLFVLYPLLEAPPPLDRLEIYLPIAGISLLWLGLNVWTRR